MSLSILSTKLHIPQPRAGIVPCERLLEQFTSGLQRKFTLISAPAGFGKTTILSAWMAQCERPVAWLSLDSTDSAPMRFLSHMIAALQAIEDTIGEGVVNALQSSQQPAMEDLLIALINEIAILELYTLNDLSYLIVSIQSQNKYRFLPCHNSQLLPIQRNDTLFKCSCDRGSAIIYP